MTIEEYRHQRNEVWKACVPWFLAFVFGWWVCYDITVLRILFAVGAGAAVGGIIGGLRALRKEFRQEYGRVG